jgi:SAM-dependent methyltransferase
VTWEKQKTITSKPFDFKRHPYRSFVVPPWFTHYVPMDDAARAHWEEQYRLAKAGKPHQVPDWSLRGPENELHRQASQEFWNEIPKNFDSILDVGCNDGWMVKVFQDSGKHAAGVNDRLMPVDWAFVEDSQLAVMEGDMHNLDLPDSSFDAVWCRHTLEHSFAPLQVLAEIYRVLKPNGYLFVVLPPPPVPPEPFPDHWHQIPDYQLQFLLESCNFNVEKLWTAWFSYKAPNDNCEIRCIARKAD